jgi:multicomponent Na+:H+ antiporter subunit D
MAFLQSSLKRMLAFVVIGHVGVFLVAIGLLTARGIAGATLYVVADGLVKGALFCGVAHVARRIGNVDELLGHGRGRVIPETGVLIAVAALGLAALPPLALLSGAGGLAPVLVVASALTGGAVLRAAGRLFLGLGPRRDELLVHAPPGEEREVPPARRSRALFWAPSAALLAAGLALAFTPGLAGRAVEQAQRFVNRPAVAQETLHGIEPAGATGSRDFSLSAWSYGYSGAGALGAIALGWLGLYRRRMPDNLRAGADRLGGPVLRQLKLVHDGVVGEYVTWLTVGAAVLGAVFAVLIR